jgi:hypothetical protein
MMPNFSIPLQNQAYGMSTTFPARAQASIFPKISISTSGAPPYGSREILQRGRIPKEVLRTPEQQIEYLCKMEIVAQQITEQAFYKRVGFWCRQCEFLPLCLGNKKKAKDTLVRIT